MVNVSSRYGSVNYRGRMSWLTSEIRRRLDGASVTKITEDNAKLLAVSTGLLRCCVEHVDGRRTVLRDQQVQAHSALRVRLQKVYPSRMAALRVTRAETGNPCAVLSPEDKSAVSSSVPPRVVGPPVPITARTRPSVLNTDTDA